MPDENEVIDMMELRGGGFISKLARAWRFADLNNRSKLRVAFSDEYRRYAEMCKPAVQPTHGSDEGYPHGE